MRNRKGKRSFLIKLILAYIALAIVYYLAAVPSLSWESADTGKTAPPQITAIGELTVGLTVEQYFIPQHEGIKAFSLMFATYDRTNYGKVAIRLVQNNITLIEKVYEASDIPNNDYIIIELPEIITGVKGERLKIEVESLDGRSGNAVTLWYGERQEGSKLSVNGQEIEGSLCFNVSEVNRVPFERRYALSAVVAGILILMSGLWLSSDKITRSLEVYKKYKFLLFQLVGRDFKTKYRRSYLGVIWSILSPLLMMMVISSVFSYLFRFDIKNFPVYLILGQTFFNFLSESTNTAMSAILGSGHLIKKVYVPKFIFPLEKVLFSFTNFIISFVAIAIVLLMYRIPITVSFICLPLVLLYIFIFSLGLGLFLSSFAIFFRDTLHLYAIVLTAWTYLTPIFYPISALSKRMAFVISLNPMHHYIKYFRNIILYGTFPTITDNWICLFFAVASLAFGLWFFNRRQDQFILYI